MKTSNRFLSLLLVLVLSLSLGAVALAADAYGGASAQATEVECTHERARDMVSNIFPRAGITSNTHEKYVLTQLYCPDCHKILSSDMSTGTTERHLFLRSYTGSNHSGHYTNHYYIYTYTCGSCSYSFEDKTPAGCDQYNCADPMSITPSVS